MVFNQKLLTFLLFVILFFIAGELLFFYRLEHQKPKIVKQNINNGSTQTSRVSPLTKKSILRVGGVSGTIVNLQKNQQQDLLLTLNTLTKGEKVFRIGLTPSACFDGDMNLTALGVYNQKTSQLENPKILLKNIQLQELGVLLNNIKTDIIIMPRLSKNNQIISDENKIVCAGWLIVQTPNGLTDLKQFISNKI